MRLAGHPGHGQPRPPRARRHQVNHVGEAVAVVVARDKASAQDALEAIEVDYDPLPVVLDMDDGAQGRRGPRPPEHTDSNKSYTWAFESGAAGTGAADRGRAATTPR